MPTTQERLDAYKAAELNALQAQSLRRGDHQRQIADLAEIRRAIRELENQLASERAAASGRVGPEIAIADFSQPLDGRSGCGDIW